VPGPTSEVQAIVELARSTLQRHLAGSSDAELASPHPHASIPPPVDQHLNSLLAHVSSYRDALLVILAVPLVRQQVVDVTVRTEGGRGASGGIGRLLSELHIKGVNDAFQNIGKNSTTLTRGNNPAFDAVLRWASDAATLDQIEAAYQLVAMAIAETARTVAPWPQLRPAKLTFPNVMGLLDDMLRTPSAGVHEQYVVAAHLQEFVGPLYRVDTKPVTASDASSRTAGDIQVISPTATEAIEVTANDWDTKLSQARTMMEQHDFQRVHIIGRVPSDLYRRLPGLVDADVSVLDVRATVAALVAVLPRQRREAALSRLYELLDRNVPAPDLVNAYVRRLHERGLTV